MPKFITIGYGDEACYKRTPPSVRDTAHAHDEKLKREGAVMGIAGPPVQVRTRRRMARPPRKAPSCRPTSLSLASP
jgi:hypothetical protein